MHAPPTARRRGPAGRSSTGRFSVAVIVGVAFAVIAAVAVVAVVAGGDREPPGADAPRGDTSERRFIRIGTAANRQFTDDELRQLATDFDYVLFTKFHDGARIASQHEAARRLKQINPELHVFPYFSTKYWFTASDWGDDQIDPDFLLRDNDGAVVPIFGGGSEHDERGSYVDLADPRYREWAMRVMAGWLDAAPYDGIAFDAADPIGDFGPDVVRFDRLLGPERVGAYNDGLRQLLRTANDTFGDDHEIIYNGFSDDPRRGPARNLDLLEFTDGALTEEFCVDAAGTVDSIGDDLAIMREYAGKRELFLRSNPPATLTGAARDRLAHVCQATFLLAWEPGWSFFQFGTSYTESQLVTEPPVLHVDVGDPAGAAQEDGGLVVRRFERGAVWVNTGDGDRTATLGAAGVLVDAAGRRDVAAGATLSIEAGDAAVLVTGV